MALKTARVDTYPHNAIADEPLDTEGFPFDTDFFSGDVPVVTLHVDMARDEVLHCPSHVHGRSYELLLNPEENGERPAWTDRYGNPYSCLTTKGNNFSQAVLRRSATAPSGFIPHGLQEGDALLRVLRASEAMRKAGIDTEWLVRIEEPKQLIYKDEFVPVDEFKRRLVGDLVTSTALRAAGVDRPKDADALDTNEVSAISKALKNMDFFITLRAMATPYRVCDMFMNGKYFSLTAAERVFEDYNLMALHRRQQLEAMGLPLELKMPDIDHMLDRGTDIESYLCEALPRLMGYNIGKLHSLGLTHNFPHLGNFTALGGLVDLDSIKGPAVGFGEEPATMQDIMDDFHHFIGKETYEEVRQLYSSVYAYFRAPEDWNPLEDFGHNFIAGYLVGRAIDIETAPGVREAVVLLAEMTKKTYVQGATTMLRAIIERYMPFDYVGSLQKAVQEIVSETAELDPDLVAATLYVKNVEPGVMAPEDEKDNYICFDEYLNNLFPETKERPPTDEELAATMRDMMNGLAEDQQGVKDINAYQIAAEDIFEDDIRPLIMAYRYERISFHLDKIAAALDEAKPNGADYPLRDLDPVTAMTLFWLFSNSVVQESLSNFVILEPEKVWAQMANLYKQQLAELEGSEIV